MNPLLAYSLNHQANIKSNEKPKEEPPKNPFESAPAFNS